MLRTGAVQSRNEPGERKGPDLGPLALSHDMVLATPLPQARPIPLAPGVSAGFGIMRRMLPGEEASFREAAAAADPGGSAAGRGGLDGSRTWRAR